MRGATLLKMCIVYFHNNGRINEHARKRRPKKNGQRTLDERDASSNQQKKLSSIFRWSSLCACNSINRVYYPTHCRTKWNDINNRLAFEVAKMGRGQTSNWFASVFSLLLMFYFLSSASPVSCQSVGSVGVSFGVNFLHMLECSVCVWAKPM